MNNTSLLVELQNIINYVTGRKVFKAKCMNFIYLRFDCVIIFLLNIINNSFKLPYICHCILTTAKMFHSGNASPFDKVV